MWYYKNIDISWVDWAYKSSTVPVTSFVNDRTAIYIMVVKIRNTFAPPPLNRSSLFIGGLRCQAIQTEQGPYIAERTQKAVDIVRYLCVRNDPK
jgi:hypothetical protein